MHCTGPGPDRPIMYAQHQTPYILRSGLVSPAEVEKLFKMYVRYASRHDSGNNVAADTLITSTRLCRYWILYYTQLRRHTGEVPSCLQSVSSFPSLAVELGLNLYSLWDMFSLLRRATGALPTSDELRAIGCWIYTDWRAEERRDGGGVYLTQYVPRSST